MRRRSGATASIHERIAAYRTTTVAASTIARKTGPRVDNGCGPTHVDRGLRHGSAPSGRPTCISTPSPAGPRQRHPQRSTDCQGSRASRWPTTARRWHDLRAGASTHRSPLDWPPCPRWAAFAAATCSSSTSSSSRSRSWARCCCDSTRCGSPTRRSSISRRRSSRSSSGRRSTSLGGLYSRAWAYASVGELVADLRRRPGRLDRRDRLLLPRPRPARRRRARRPPSVASHARSSSSRACSRSPGWAASRFLIRASTEWKGWRPGDPDRRERRPTGGRTGADARLRRGRRRRDRPADDRRGARRARACASSACSTTTARKRNQILRGQKVLGGTRRARRRSPASPAPGGS